MGQRRALASRSRFSGGVAGPSFIPPTLFPANGSQTWNLVGATDSIRSGSALGAGHLFNDVNGDFLGSDASTGFVLDAGAGPAGINAAKTSFVGGGGDHSAACNWHLAVAVKEIWVGFAHKFDVATGNFTKEMRIRGDDNNNSILITPGLDAGHTFISRWDQWQGSPTDSGIVARIGSFDYIILHAFLKPGGLCLHELWINGVLGVSETLDFSGASTLNPVTNDLRFQSVTFDGTVNNPGSSGNCWASMFAISTSPIVTPSGFGFPGFP